jgi:hypothetical protein
LEGIGWIEGLDGSIEKGVTDESPLSAFVWSGKSEYIAIGRIVVGAVQLAQERLDVGIGGPVSKLVWSDALSWMPMIGILDPWCDGEDPQILTVPELVVGGRREVSKIGIGAWFEFEVGLGW